MLKNLSLALAAAALLAACGGSSHHSGPNIACNFAADSECDEVTGPQAVLDTFNFTPAGCTGGGGVVVSSCPTNGRAGRCTLTFTGGGATATVLATFYTPAWDAATVQSDCVSAGGTYSARLAGVEGAWGSGAAPVEASFDAE